MGPLSALSASPSLPPAPAQLQIDFVNRSDSVCTLRGYPRLILRTTSRQRMRLRIHDQDAGVLRREGLGATVILDPGSQVGFIASYRICPLRAPANTAVVHLAGVAGALRPSLASTGRTVRPCGGRIEVSSL